MLAGCPRASAAAAAGTLPQQKAAIGAVNGYIEEMIEGPEGHQGLQSRGRRQGGLSGAERDATGTRPLRAQTYAGAMMPAMGNLGHINYAVTCCVGGLLAIRSGDLGGLAAFLQYTRQVSQPITQISQQVNTILSAVAGAERVFEVMETQPEPDDGTVTLERVVKAADGTLRAADLRHRRLGVEKGGWHAGAPPGGRAL